MARILIIDDDPMFCKTMAQLVAKLGHDSAITETCREGLEQAVQTPTDVILLDVQLPDGNGLDLLPDLKDVASNPEVIIMTGSGDPDGAELAINSGAWDYIEKTASTKQMTLPLIRALNYREEKLGRQSPVLLKREEIIGSCLNIKRCLEQVAQASFTDTNVLISGESGTGKELFSRSIHDNSARNARNFVVVDCTALPESLVESVLFGHVKGAFTGAHSDQNGLIKQADGGTLFLDEVGEMPLNIQKKFLRVLQDHRFRPIGGKREQSSNFRLISATNRHLDHLADEGGFRRDLLFRLQALKIELPPLRERKDDIKRLTQHFVTKLSERDGVDIKGISPEVFEVLQQYEWPGNVRELYNVLDGAMAQAVHDPTLYGYHLPAHIRIRTKRDAITSRRPSNPASTAAGPEACDFPDLKAFKEQTEHQYLQDLMKKADGSVEEAVDIAGVSRSHIYGLLKKHQLSHLIR